MINYISQIKDVLQNNYLGVIIFEDFIKNFLEDFKNYIGDEKYIIYTKNQKERDRGGYHLTVFNTIEYNKILLKKNIKDLSIQLEKLFNYPIDDLIMVGIGNAKHNNNESYFIVCKSEKIQNIRNIFDLPDKDLHITIGFNFRDVHGVPKNQVLKIDLAFIKLFKKYYYDDNEDFEWVKYLQNFNGNEDYDIKILNLKDNSARFRIGDKHYCDVIEAGGDLIIGATWHDDIPESEIPIMSKTILNRKLKNNV